MAIKEFLAQPTTSAGICPSGVAVDTSGNLYIADKSNNRIRKVDSKGIITTIAGYRYGAGLYLGIATGLYSGDGGPATSAKLDAPEAVTVDVYGNLYIADTYNLRIRKVPAQSKSAFSRSCSPARSLTPVVHSPQSN